MFGRFQTEADNEGDRLKIRSSLQPVFMWKAVKSINWSNYSGRLKKHFRECRKLSLSIETRPYFVYKTGKTAEEAKPLAERLINCDPQTSWLRGLSHFITRTIGLISYTTTDMPDTHPKIESTPFLQQQNLKQNRSSRAQRSFQVMTSEWKTSCIPHATCHDSLKRAMTVNQQSKQAAVILHSAQRQP